jgi:hypothetical protein
MANAPTDTQAAGSAGSYQPAVQNGDGMAAIPQITMPTAAQLGAPSLGSFAMPQIPDISAMLSGVPTNTNIQAAKPFQPIKPDLSGVPQAGQQFGPTVAPAKSPAVTTAAQMFGTPTTTVASKTGSDLTVTPGGKVLNGQVSLRPQKGTFETTKEGVQALNKNLQDRSQVIPVQSWAQTPGSPWYQKPQTVTQTQTRYVQAPASQPNYIGSGLGLLGTLFSLF